MSGIYLVITLVCIACAALMLYRSKTLNEVEIETIEQPEPLYHGSRIKIQTGVELLAARQDSVRHIRELLGYSNASFETDVINTLERFAEFVQLIPASQSHHHAHPGGLLDHSLEVAIIALRRSTQKELPLNTPTETRIKLAPAWRFGVMVGALLHDVGKPLVSVEVQLFESPTANEDYPWNPFIGAMPSAGQCRYYRIEFPEQAAAYRTHERLAFSVFNQIVPQSTSHWLNTVDPKLLDELRFLLSAEKPTVFDDIVKAADQESVAINLRHGIRTRFATARLKPMIETMMESLQHMVSERNAYFSSSIDSGAELFRKDGRVYIMAKVFGDRLRAFVRENRLGAIPDDNLRIFATLFEYGASLPNPFDSRKSVWDVKVQMKSAGQVQVRQFTMLCFAESTLFKDGAWIPENYAGDIVAFEKSDENITEVGQNLSNLEQLAQPLSEQPNEHAANQEAQATKYAAIQKEQPLPLLPPLGTQLSEQGIQANGVATIPQAKTTDEPNPIALFPENDSTQGESDSSSEENANLFDVSSYLTNAISSIGTPVATETIAAKTVTTTIEKAPVLEKPVIPVKTPQRGASHVNQLLAQLDSILPEPNQAARLAPDNAITLDKVSMSSPDLAAIKVIEEAKAQQLAQQVFPEDFEASRKNIEPKTTQQLGQQFINWLQTSISNSEVVANGPSSFVHTVTQGALLVTPRIFAAFLQNTSTPTKQAMQELRELQLAFEQLKLHQKINGVGIHQANIEAVNNRVQARLNVYLIPTVNLQLLFDAIPSPNPHIKLVEAKKHELRP